MDNDLISRSALKEIWELYEKYQPSLATNVYEFGVALKGIIDNAPTVEYTFEEAFQKTVCEQRLYCPARPQGEWNKIGKDTFNCNKCGHTFIIIQGENSMHFCPNCGADMRGEKE